MLLGCNGIFYSDELVIDAETGLVTKYFLKKI